MNRTSLLSGAFFPAALAIGCNAGGDAESAAVVRDSADIRIIENFAPRWRPGEAWRLSAEPVVDIGGVDEDPSRELYGVTSSIRLRNGDIVIANNGTRELRFFDSTGVYRFSEGRRGEGPGEFTFVNWVRPWRGDSVVVRSPGRLTFFDGSGAFGRLVTVRVPNMLLTVRGIFPDGSIFGTALLTASSAPQAGLHRRSEKLIHVAADGESYVDSVGWAPGLEMFTYRVNDDLTVAAAPEIPRNTWYAAHADAFYVGTNDTYEVEVYTSTGTLRTLVRYRRDNPEVTRADIDAIRERRERYFLDRPANIRQAWEGFYEAAPLPETWPAFGKTDSPHALHIDAQADIWVEEYDRPEEEQNGWTVFDADGVLLGVVELPARFEPHDIGDDYVLGRWRDDLDVEHVRMYELIKPGADQ
jgi:hypothetical protein